MITPTPSRDGENRATIRIEVRLTGTEMAMLLSHMAARDPDWCYTDRWSRSRIEKAVREACVSCPLEMLEYPEVVEGVDYDRNVWAAEQVREVWPNMVTRIPAAPKKCG